MCVLLGNMKVLFITLFYCVSLVCAEDDLLVSIKHGSLKGTYMKSSTGREFRAFLKIPYIKPPVGELRFKTPVAAENWIGIRDATKDMPMCVANNIYIRQFDVIGDEDCIYLNVYTPKKSDIKEPLPVMIFIHGGGFHTSSGNAMIYPPGYLMNKDIVLVSINYRLGPLGFLTTGDDVVPGNNGMKDQVMALKWIQQNIDMFGGNPKSVTIFGESAGGTSSHLHMMSPLSKGLFHAAVAESGCAMNNWATMPLSRGVRYTKELATIVNCPTKPSEKMVECLRNVDAKQIMGSIKHFLQWDIDPSVIFAPVIEPKNDGAFLTESFESAVKNGLVNDVPLMIGLTSSDGALRTCGIVSNNLLQEFNDKFNEIFHINAFNEKTKYFQNIESTIKTYYFGTEDMSVSNLTNYFTDMFFSIGIHDAVDLHRRYSKSPIYFYQFDYRGSTSFTQLMGRNDDDFGVSHADELLYLFPIKFKQDIVATDDDKKMADILTTLWTNFAKHNNPTPNNNLGVIWKPVKTKHNEYLNIQLSKLKMEKDMISERRQFWKEIQPLFTDDIRDEL